MIVEITAVETIYDPPPGGVGVYRIGVVFENRGNAVFTQSFVVPPKRGETWDMPHPRLERFLAHQDGSPR